MSDWEKLELESTNCKLALKVKELTDEIERLQDENKLLWSVYKAAEGLLDQHDNADDCTDGFERLDEAVHDVILLPGERK